MCKYWAHLQSVHGFRCCYDNVARTRNFSECSYSICAWSSVFQHVLNVSRSHWSCVQCSWMKDGKMLRPGDRYEIVYTLGICSLEVAACDMSDAGKYTCIAENSQGTEECMCKVTVNGTPYSTICYTQRDAHHTTLPFTAPFPGPPGCAGAKTELLDFIVQGKINRGRHTAIRMGATPSGLSSAHLHHPPIFYRPDSLPAAQPTVSKH